MDEELRKIAKKVARDWHRAELTIVSLCTVAFVVLYNLRLI